MYFGKSKKNSLSGRVPPNQNVTTSFPVLHHGNVPYYKDLSKWALRLFGLVEQEQFLTYDDLLAMPLKSSKNDIHCVTGWSKLDNHWEGVSTNDIVHRAALKPEVRFVILHAEEGWSTNLPLEDFIRDTSMLAYAHNGQVLSPEHGYPLRAVFPHLYFWKSAKWLKGIEFTREDKPGFWEKNGYHNYGDPWKEQRLTWD
ncbi:sulfite oxidase-like oxidoreductase [Mesobacillus foraminis]|uniref:sulfite oxidase-like oxidoreductase n=1 Tax=Mesobacillus foraminis TaxID=279826 RepID=UPI000EF46626|nr:sulfite oxidase-like oxidoreductase [Mesobacillus foraminis]